MKLTFNLRAIFRIVQQPPSRAEIAKRKRIANRDTLDYECRIDRCESFDISVDNLEIKTSVQCESKEESTYRQNSGAPEG